MKSKEKKAKLKSNTIKVKNKKGITLIALVVTIIVLLILAGITIASIAGENGILNRASDAREQTEQATEEEQNTLQEYEYQVAKSLGEISETETCGEYTMEKEIKEKYGQDIKIGDTVNYEDNVAGYEGTWNVLGVENGQVLLMSSNHVGSIDELGGKDGFLNLESKLDGECEKYGKGQGAESARSLRVEDINKITGYNPKNPRELDKCCKGTVAEYGETVTFTLSDGHIKCKCSNGVTKDMELQSFEHIDGRRLGEENVSEISFINGSYTYRYGERDLYDGNDDWSFHKPVSEGLKKLFIFSEINMEGATILATRSMVGNRKIERR